MLAPPSMRSIFPLLLRQALVYSLPAMMKQIFSQIRPPVSMYLQPACYGCGYFQGTGVLGGCSTYSLRWPDIFVAMYI